MKNLILTISSCLLPAIVAAQGLTNADLLKPLSTDWPTYSGDYTGRRYSKLIQVNQSNVKDLTLAWASRLTAGAGGGGRGGGRFGGGAAVPLIVAGEGTGETGGGGFGGTSVKGSILEVNGILYVSTPITPGRWTPSMAANCGTSSGRPRAAHTSAIAGSACGATGFTWRRLTIT